MTARVAPWRAQAAVIAVAFFWGTTFVVVKDALTDISTHLFLAVRFTLATALMALALRGRLRRGSTAGSRSAEWKGGLTCGLFLFLGYALQTAGLRHTSASNSAFLTGLYIVVVPLLGSLVNKSRPRWAELGGAAAATLGTALMTSGSLDLKLNAGDLMTVGCAIAFSAHILAVTHYSRKMSFERLSVFQVASVAAFSWLATGALGATALEPARVAWSGRVWFGLGTTALIATALSFLLYTWAQQHLSANRATLLLALEPVFAGLMAWLIAGEHWSAGSLIGAGLILLGIVMVEMKPPMAAEHPLP